MLGEFARLVLHGGFATMVYLEGSLKLMCLEELLDCCAWRIPLAGIVWWIHMRNEKRFTVRHHVPISLMGRLIGAQDPRKLFCLVRVSLMRLIKERLIRGS